MALNIKKLSSDRARSEASQGSKFSGTKILRRLEPGVTTIWLPPPTSEMDDLPYVRADHHFGIAALNPAIRYPVFCLEEDNDGVWHEATLREVERINAFRKEKGRSVTNLDPSAPCPLDAIVNGTDPELAHLSARLDEAQARSLSRKESYLFPYVPMAFATLSDPDRPTPYTAKDMRPFLMPLPVTGYMDLIAKIEDVVRDAGKDPTDPEAGIFFKMKYFKNVNGFWSYEAGPDLKSLMAPTRLPKAVRVAVSTMCVPGGEACPFRYIAGNLKDATQILELVQAGGVSPSTSKPDEDKPACFGVDPDSDDPECWVCPFKVGCAKEAGVEVPPDAKPAGKTAKPAAPEPPDEDEDEVEEEDEEESPPFDAAKEFAEEPEPDEEEPDEEEDEEDEEEEPEPPKAAAKSFRDAVAARKRKRGL